MFNPYCETDIFRILSKICNFDITFECMKKYQAFNTHIVENGNLK